MLHRPPVTYPNGTVEKYTYDQVGNWATRTYAGTTVTYTCDNDNRLTSSTDGYSYTYDANGNLRTKTKGSSRTYYGYDYENRLNSVTLPGGTVVSYGYGPDGVRTSRSVSGTSPNRYYGYDLLAPGGLPEVTSEYGGSSPDTEVVYGTLTDQPLEEILSTTPYDVHHDALGSVTSLTDSTQTVKGSYRYSAFGSQTSSTGTLTSAYRYTGREWDSTTGLYYYRARYYDPSTGRFLSKDPAGMVDGTNQYVYAANNPVDYLDPTGEKGEGRCTTKVCVRERITGNYGVGGPRPTPTATDENSAGGSTSPSSATTTQSADAGPRLDGVCGLAWSILAIQVVGGLIFGFGWSALVEAIDVTALASAAIAFHLGNGLWIPEFALAIQAGAIWSVIGTVIEIGGFVLAAVAKALGFWGGFTIAAGETTLYGPGVVINLGAAAIGLGISLYELNEHGCL